MCILCSLHKSSFSSPRVFCSIPFNLQTNHSVVVENLNCISCTIFFSLYSHFLRVGWRWAVEIKTNILSFLYLTLWKVFYVLSQIMVHHDDSFCSRLANGDAKYFCRYSFVRSTWCYFRQEQSSSKLEINRIYLLHIFSMMHHGVRKSHYFWQKINQYLLYLIMSCFSANATPPSRQVANI